MVAIFSNLDTELTVPVECISFRITSDSVIIITDESDELVIDSDTLNKNGTFTAVECMDYVGLGISIFSFKRDYING